VRRRLRFALATNRPFERIVLATPALRARARRAAARYVAGETLEEALAVAARLRTAGLACSLDLFGERERDPARIEQALAGYEALAAAIQPGTWVSVDLSHVGLETATATDALRRIGAALPDGARLQVGAEEAARAEAILDAVLAAHADGVALTATVQANLRRSPGDAQRLAAAGVPVRLVKGAYVEASAVAHPYGPQTDAAFGALAAQLHAAGATVLLATHDPALRDVLPDAPVEMLLGVRSQDAVALAAAGRDVRIYAPYGHDWLRYLLRRRAEAEGTG
jgi:proline dehydrogenase